MEYVVYLDSCVEVPDESVDGPDAAITAAKTLFINAINNGTATFRVIDPS